MPVERAGLRARQVGSCTHRDREHARRAQRLVDERLDRVDPRFRAHLAPGRPQPPSRLLHEQVSILLRIEQHLWYRRLPELHALLDPHLVPGRLTIGLGQERVCRLRLKTWVGIGGRRVALPRPHLHRLGALVNAEHRERAGHRVLARRTGHRGVEVTQRWIVVLGPLPAGHVRQRHRRGAPRARLFGRPNVKTTGAGTAL